MGKKAPKAPAAPDPATTAAAQTQTNKDTAYWNAVLNNVNQVTPYGSLSYEQSGGGKKYNMEAYNKALEAFNASSGSKGQGVVLNDQGFIDGQSYSKGATPLGAPGSTYYPSVGASGAAMPKLEDFYISESPPSFTSTIKLSPEQQQLYDMQTAQDKSLLQLGGDQISRIQQNASTPFSFNGLGNEIDPQQIAEARAAAEEALMSRLNPQFGRDEEALRTRLINQGITQGSEAYNREMEGFGQNKNDARMQAVLNAARYGGDLQNQALQRRNQSIQEYTTQRNAPLNEYIGFTSGTQIQNPTFQSQGYGGAAPADITSAINQQYQGQLGAYNAKVAGNNSTMGNLFGLGGSLLGAAGGAGGFGKLFGF